MPVSTSCKEQMWKDYLQTNLKWLKLQHSYLPLGSDNVILIVKNFSPQYSRRDFVLKKQSFSLNQKTANDCTREVFLCSDISRIHREDLNRLYQILKEWSQTIEAEQQVSFSSSLDTMYRKMSICTARNYNQYYLITV